MTTVQVIEEQKLVIVQAPGPQGPPGVAGAAGPAGSAGPQGNPGEGVAVGGTTNQILRKASATDYDTAWTSLKTVAGNSLLGTGDVTVTASAGGSAGDIQINSAGALSGLTPGTGVATALAANVTGSGGIVLATSPSLTTPNLGTPSALNLTNATALPVSGISATGTPSSGTYLRGDGSWQSVTTAPAGSNGDFQINNAGAFGALTPGSGVSTFLTTPSSANLAAAVTDETGSGALVFATSPTLTTPNLGTPSALTLTNATGLPVGGISATGTPSSTTYLRGDGSWQTVTSGGTPGGSDTQIQFNSSGTFAGASGLTTTGTELTIASGTKTASAPVIDATQTWNSAGVTFTGFKLNVTNTASAAASTLLDFQVGGTSVFNLTRLGKATFQSSATGYNDNIAARITNNNGVASLVVAGTSSASTNADVGFFVGGSTQSTRSVYGLSGNFADISAFTDNGFAIGNFNDKPLIFGQNNVERARFTNGGFLLATTSFLGWNNTYLVRDADNVLAQRNGISAQTFRVYNTFTDASNYERGFMRWSSNVLEIGSEAGGTGTVRNLRFMGGTSQFTRSSYANIGTRTSPTLLVSATGLYGYSSSNATDAVAGVYGRAETGYNSVGVLAVAGATTGSNVQNYNSTGVLATAVRRSGTPYGAVGLYAAIRTTDASADPEHYSNSACLLDAGNYSGATLIQGINHSVTGSGATSAVSLVSTWNTTGAPTAINLNVTDTASGAASLLLNLQVGGATKFSVAKSGSVTVADAADIAVGTTTGTKLGTATTQKLGFWNATPIVQPANSVAIDDVLVNTGLRASGGTANFATAVTAPNLANGRTLARFTPLDNQPPAANFATLDTRNSIAVLDFDAATDESAVFVGVVPEGATLTSGIVVRIFWMATSATSGDCVWGAQFEKYGTDYDSDSFDTATTATTTTSGTSGIAVLTSITCTSIDSLAAGDLFRVKIYRDADSASDTMTGDAELIAVELRAA